MLVDPARPPQNLNLERRDGHPPPEPREPISGDSRTSLGLGVTGTVTASSLDPEAQWAPASCSTQHYLDLEAKRALAGWSTQYSVHLESKWAPAGWSTQSSLDPEAKRAPAGCSTHYFLHLEAKRARRLVDQELP
ncbi:unnamed protein product [Rangifer tarandus platyrhynchus]|uniref:Uncharacterized protein n=2 Tax=Rangifer tarandus platyrhynchus TaxID=3082113 RepID=A0ABN8ZVR1_RANTA|nr:unnamed protein product [Rangifer tarandus platyrhynchus]CAI9711938.1 unnamed protein product [Rangifer tarandus platyrhynchus]